MEAARLAVTLRVMLHDTANSHSVIGQLGIKDRLQYLNTAAPVNPANVLNTFGLVLVQADFGPKGKGRYLPLVASGDPVALWSTLAPFESWWNDPVAKIKGQPWSRRDLVLKLANQEGGAHVDPDRDPGYESIATGNALGWTFTGSNGASAPFEGNYIAAAVRQIVFEVEKTLDAHDHLLAP